MKPGKNEHELIDGGGVLERDGETDSYRVMPAYAGPSPGLVVLVVVAVLGIGVAALRYCVKHEPVRTYSSSCDYAGGR